MKLNQSEPIAPLSFSINCATCLHACVCPYLSLSPPSSPSWPAARVSPYKPGPGFPSPLMHAGDQILGFYNDP